MAGEDEERHRDRTRREIGLGLIISGLGKDGLAQDSARWPSTAGLRCCETPRGVAGLRLADSPALDCSWGLYCSSDGLVVTDL